MHLKLDESFNVNCFILKDDLRVVFWEKNSEKVKTDQEKLEAITSVKTGELLHHSVFGELTAKSTYIDGGQTWVNVVLNDDPMTIKIDELFRKVNIYDYKLIQQINRLFIIKGTDVCTLYVFKDKCWEYTKVCDMNTVIEVIDIAVKNDNMSALLSLDAKWKKNPPSEKQLSALSKTIKQRDLKIDLSSIKTMGDASVLFDYLKNDTLLKRIHSFSFDLSELFKSDENLI